MHKTHVGRKQILCPDLFIDNWKVESSDSFTTGIAGVVVSEGTLTSSDDLLGYNLEAIHVVANYDLSPRILPIYPQL